MADWPQPDELKLVIDFTADDQDLTLDRLLAAAIARVKTDVGDWDEDVDQPDEALSAAALRMAELISSRPEAVRERFKDVTYSLLLKGHRRRFGVA
jgi:hypothetical protein